MLSARVENRGNAAVPAGVEVRFGPGRTARTTRPLLPGGAEWVRSAPIERRRLRALTVEVRVDPSDAHRECDEGSANALSLSLGCEP